MTQGLDVPFWPSVSWMCRYQLNVHLFSGDVLVYSFLAFYCGLFAGCGLVSARKQHSPSCYIWSAMAKRTAINVVVHMD